MGFNFKKLQIEVTTDPTSVGYSSMTDAEVADSLNSRVVASDRDSVPSIEVLGSIVPDDYPADARLQSYLQVLLSQPEIPMSDPEIRSGLLSIFKGKTATLANLKGLEKRNISRAQLLGLGRIKAGFVAAVRKGQ